MLVFIASLIPLLINIYKDCKIQNTIFGTHLNCRELIIREVHTHKRFYDVKNVRKLYVIGHFEVDPRGVNKDFEKALTYARNQRESLCRFLEDGNIPAHNNRAENAIRPFVIGRKNWLFSQTAKGASASADMYSLVETAKANGVDVFEYLSWLFRQITAANHNFTDEFLEKLMPWSEQAQDSC